MKDEEELSRLAEILELMEAEYQELVNCLFLEDADHKQIKLRANEMFNRIRLYREEFAILVRQLKTTRE